MVASFDSFIDQPENANRNFEWIAGKSAQKVVSNPRVSTIGALMAGLLVIHTHHRGLGRVTGAGGGYVVSGDKYLPDAAYMSKARQPHLPTDAYNPLAPDLAIEVLSPPNDDNMLRIKIANYLAAGTVVWVVDLRKRRVEVYQNGKPPRVLGIGQILDGGDLLPDFKLAVKDIFVE